ncbi:Uncharacterized protein HZ326_15222 [Fusarium oxysporum f. sp. albedinis]|nr:Uncharacterized protein HZ326_15222 [Fusarium oxysporum f. sp. albedinis]
MKFQAPRQALSPTWGHWHGEFYLYMACVSSSIEQSHCSLQTSLATRRLRNETMEIREEWKSCWILIVHQGVVPRNLCTLSSFPKFTHSSPLEPYCSFLPPVPRRFPFATPLVTMSSTDSEATVHAYLIVAE